MFRKLQTIIVLVLFCTISFYGGYYFGKRGFLIEIKKNPPNVTILNREPKDQTIDFKNFWVVWDVLNTKHIDRPLDAQKLVYGAISGMVKAVGDDYTSYFTPEQNQIVTSSLNGTYEGIGAELGFDKNKQIIIVSPFDGSPASRAGLLPGDKILEIDGQSTFGLAISDAVVKIRGKANTEVKLKIQRGENEPKDYAITRGNITAKAVEYKDLGEGVGYLKLSRFGETTTRDWTTEVLKMTTSQKDLKAVVVDVRGNPGGFLDAAIYISSEFIIDGPVLWEELADGTQNSFEVNRAGLLTKVPVVVLIDKGSASASEIVASALKDRRNAKLVGMTSFGKGTVQASEDFADKSSLHVTVAKWLSPNKTWVHKVGIKPDFEVDRTEDDILSGRDPQLDAAKEVAKNAKN